MRRVQGSRIWCCKIKDCARWHIARWYKRIHGILESRPGWLNLVAWTNHLINRIFRVKRRYLDLVKWITEMICNRLSAWWRLHMETLCNKCKESDEITYPFPNLEWISNFIPHFLLGMCLLIHAGIHDDVIKWKHFPRYWPFARGIHRSPVNSQHKGQWRGASCFLWSAPWANNGEAGDLWRHRVH